MCCASSMSPRPRRWPTAWTKKPVRPCWCSISVAARSTCRSLKWVKASLKLSPRRATFEHLTAGLVERCAGPVQQALADAKLTARDIDEVVLVGGSTRIPAVQALVRRMTGGKEPNQSVNPDEVVAVGAAIQAGVLA